MKRARCWAALPALRPATSRTGCANAAPRPSCSPAAQGRTGRSRRGIAEIPVPRATPVDVTGAGDALIAGTLFGLLNGEPLAEAVGTGTLVALLTIQSPATVSRALDVAAVNALRARFAVRA